MFAIVVSVVSQQIQMKAALDVSKLMENPNKIPAPKYRINNKRRDEDGKN